MPCFEKGHKDSIHEMFQLAESSPAIDFADSNNAPSYDLFGLT